MSIKAVYVAGLCAVLAGCGGSATNNLVTVAIGTPQVGRANVNADGTVPTTMQDTITSSRVATNGDGFGYVLGPYADQSTVGAFSGLTGSTSLTGTLPPGTATMDGQFRIGELYDLTRENGKVVGQQRQAGGLISLNADFGARTLQGSATISGTSIQLQILGAFNGNSLGGSVTYGGLTGDLEGQIDGGRAVGVFAGQSANSAFAGGFMVDD